MKGKDGQVVQQRKGYRDTIPVRKGEEIDILKLDKFLVENIEGLNREAPLQVEQFPAGASNLTYLIRKGDWEAVLRRPPLGPVAPRAHDMGREYLILKAVHPYFKLAPKPYLFTDNTTIIGSPFLIMERKNGHVINTEFPEGVTPTKELGEHICEKMIDTLVQLHAIDYRQTEIKHIVKPEGFIERQVSGWIERYKRVKTDDIREVDELTKWLTSHIPQSPSPTIIHYDYKLNNIMFDFSFENVIGLFDWEMTTVGDPLADLGVALGYWVEKDDPDELKQGLSMITTLPGFMTREEMIEEYAKKSGRDISNIQFYLAFAYFKNAVIVQQIYYRYKRGQTQDKRFAALNKFTNQLIQLATKMIDKYKN